MIFLRLLTLHLLMIACVESSRLHGQSGGGSDQQLQVGFASIDITPPVGFRMGGGYGEKISTGVHDPLYAKAMVLRQGSVSFGIVICDLLSVPETLSRQARRRAEEVTAIPADCLVIAATHNHGSPEYWGSLRDIFHGESMRRTNADPHESIDYQKLLVARCVEAIDRASASVADAACEVIDARQIGLAFNRRFHMRDGSVRFNPGRLNPQIIEPAGPIDPQLSCLLFRSGNSWRPIGAFSVFALHTAVFGGTEFGGDFPAQLQLRLRESFGEQFVSVFAEGTAGDINHIDVSRESMKGDLSVQIGDALAKTILRELENAEKLSDIALKISRTTVPAKLIPSSRARFEQAKSILANQASNRTPFLELVAAWRDIHAFRYVNEYGASKPMEVQAVRINSDTAIVTLPHEIFVELGLAIKANSPFRNTAVVSLANDVDFYIPTRRAFEEGSYEVTTCPFQPGCGELLVRAAGKLLDDLHESEEAD